MMEEKEVGGEERGRGRGEVRSSEYMPGVTRF